ncbi:MAG: anaerobic ribonucleoside-triphosphate reductase activating protein [Actinobacteria bacterium]|nr:anaerobic ribonucleoside-triphosphate reductase activating protein [Actinomycetota bacterium]
MIIGGLQKFSLIDYPHKISAIIFTIGCNFRCPFCHNPELVNPGLYPEKIPENNVFEFLESRREKLDAVVISGGEPTLHKDLYQFISKLKSMGFLIKLDTNGTYPNILNRLIKDNLLNYIAMDIKGSLDRYEEIVTTKVNLENIKDSINIILSLDKSSKTKDILNKKTYYKSPDTKINYEFRTTVLPKFHNEDEIHKIGKLVNGAKLFILQKFYPSKTLDLKFLKENQFSDDQMLKFKKILENYVQKCLIR